MDLRKQAVDKGVTLCRRGGLGGGVQISRMPKEPSSPSSTSSSSSSSSDSEEAQRMKEEEKERHRKQ